jgi:hypothetical protein
MKVLASCVVATMLMCSTAVMAQTAGSTVGGTQSAYTPKFAGDPARSDSEAAALGYMRVVVNAQKNYRKKHAGYSTSLAGLVNQGSFTKRMVATTRGDYTVKFKGEKDGYALWMTPTTMDSTHRAFFVDENGKIKAEEDKQASASSPGVSAK